MKYINHSCIDNNCELVYLNSKIVGVISKRKIKADEFFHYDYNLHYVGSKKQNSLQGSLQSKCLCHNECPNSI
jgi:SET domain-containing protein